MTNSCKHFAFEVKHSSKRPITLLQASSHFHVIFVPSWAPDTSGAANFPKNTIQPHATLALPFSLFTSISLGPSALSSERTQPSSVSPGMLLQQQHWAFVSKCQAAVSISRRNCFIYFRSSCQSKSGDVGHAFAVILSFFLIIDDQRNRFSVAWHFFETDHVRRKSFLNIAVNLIQVLWGFWLNDKAVFEKIVYGKEIHNDLPPLESSICNFLVI